MHRHSEHALAFLAPLLVSCGHPAASVESMGGKSRIGNPRFRTAAAQHETAGVGSVWTDPLALDPTSPFHLVARGDYDLILSVTEAGAFVTHLACDVPRKLIHPKAQDYEHNSPRTHDAWAYPLQIRRASGDAWLDDKLAHTPIPTWSHYEATVEARSSNDIWVDRTPGNLNCSAFHGYFHWNGSAWEDANKLLTIPDHLTPVALLNWYGTKLLPLLPRIDSWYGGPAKLNQLPLFAVWGAARAAPSFRTLIESSPGCSYTFTSTQNRFEFASIPNGDVFVLQRPCQEEKDTGAGTTRVARWSNGHVTVASFAESYSQMTVGRFGNSDTVLVWGLPSDQPRPLIRMFLSDRWVPIEPPKELSNGRVRQSVVFDSGALWVDFGEMNRLWRYDGRWHTYPAPDSEYVMEPTFSNGEIWLSSSMDSGIHHFRGERWHKVTLFRNSGHSFAIKILPANRDDVWAIAKVTDPEEVRIYRTRPMPLLVPCP